MTDIYEQLISDYNAIEDLLSRECDSIEQAQAQDNIFNLMYDIEQAYNAKSYAPRALAHAENLHDAATDLTALFNN